MRATEKAHTSRSTNQRWPGIAIFFHHAIFLLRLLFILPKIMRCGIIYRVLEWEGGIAGTSDEVPVGGDRSMISVHRLYLSNGTKEVRDPCFTLK